MTSTEQTFEGPIAITRRGTGFFSIDPEQDDLIIEPENTGHAFPGDIVKVELAGFVEDPKSKKKRQAGKVIAIVKRTREKFVGKLVPPNDEDAAAFGHGVAILVPDWKKMSVPFIVRGESLPFEQKVVINFKGWNENEKFPWGTLDEIIGPAGVHETEMRALALSQGFHSSFPPGVMAEAAELETTGKGLINKDAEEGIASGRRKDFRKITTFTIDPADAKDFDDAISVRTLENGNTEVGVHIADVSYFVRPGTSIDDEARERATSVYLVDRTIPMLPHVLSTNLCSLNPHEDRLAVSAVFELNSNAEVQSKWFGETVIYSDKRFTYEEAQEVLENGHGTLHDELSTIAALAKKIRVRRVAKGAIEFDTPEVKVELDETGKPIRVYTKERKDTNLLIEDFMLLANEAVATMLSEKTLADKMPNGSIYRVHDSPDADRIQNLSEFLKVLGYDLPTTAGNVKGVDINALLDQVKGKPEEYLIKVATLRSMSKAIYTTKNLGHYGLAFDFYTHFTSPIRRYPDLLIHRLVKHYSAGEPMSKKEMGEFDELALHSSEREVGAAEAERDSVKMKLVEFMMDKIGEEFEGVISGVSDRGLYVELKDTHAEGMISIRLLGDDYYIYDEKRYRIVGERTKVTYALGDPIRVQLVAARLQDKELDFALAAPTQ